MIQTRTHSRCAATDCTRTRRDAILQDRRWNLVHGYVAHHGRDVAGSWAEACPEHAAEVAQAVHDDVADHPDAWHVTITTHAYGTSEPNQTRTHSSGDGGTLF